MGILQTPHRFRTKRQLWTYCGLGVVVTSSSADHEVANGQLRRKKKAVEIRGLNENCNHEPNGIPSQLQAPALLRERNLCIHRTDAELTAVKRTHWLLSKDRTRASSDIGSESPCARHVYTLTWWPPSFVVGTPVA